MKKLFVISLSLLLTFSCAHGHKAKPESNIQITKSLKGNKFSNLYFSGQPSASAIKELKDAGFATVINLRGKTEGKYQEYWEEGAVKAEELNYYNLPYSTSTPLTEEYIDSVTQTVVKHRKEGKVLVHCSSGNRVALWLGAHFKKDHGFNNDQSMEVAKKLGLTNAKVEGILKAYLNK